MGNLDLRVANLSATAQEVMECIDRGDTEEMPINNADALSLAQLLIRTSLALVNTAEGLDVKSSESIESHLLNAIDYIDANI